MHRAKNNNISLLGYVFISILMLSVFSFSSLICVADGTTTLVSIDPETIWILPGESFEVNVSCVPGQSIKSYELKLSFDPTVIKVNTVTIGTLFDGFPIYSSNGTIDNNAGNVSDIFCLILGEGNVTDPGTLISVSCSSLGVLGDSAFEIFDAGVTNETGYLPISVINGSVVVQYNISITNPSPMNAAANQDKDLSKVSVKIQHRYGKEFDYHISTNPAVGTSSGFNQINGTKECLLSNLSYSTTYHWYVSVQEKSTGEWTNRSFWFTTETKPSGGGSGGGEGGGGGGSSGSTPIEEENLAPIKPIKPFGPHIIEPGIMYSYSSHTYDPNGDMIRYRFKWGDGNLSNWTEFKPGNESVSLEYSWKTTSNFTIQILAQDEHRLNSSWSDSLQTISILDQNDIKDLGYFNPVANFSYLMNESKNDSIKFNASTSFYFNGTIVNYYWDFGDGTTGTGVIINHTYTKEGLYNVTLFVKDKDEKVDSKTLRLYAESSVDYQKVNQQGENNILWFIIITGFFGSAVLIILFKTHIITTFLRPKKMDNNKSYMRGLAKYWSKVVTNLQSIGQGIKLLYHQQRIKNVIPAGKDRKEINVIPQSVTMGTEYVPALDIVYEKVTDLNPIDHYQVLRNRVDELLSLNKNNNDSHQVLRNRVDELLSLNKNNHDSNQVL